MASGFLNFNIMNINPLISDETLEIISRFCQYTDERLRYINLTGGEVSKIVDEVHKVSIQAFYESNPERVGKLIDSLLTTRSHYAKMLLKSKESSQHDEIRNYITYINKEIQQLLAL